MLAATGMLLAAGAAHSQYASELSKLADTIKMQQYGHYRNFHRMRGWVYALHHLLTTGKPMAAYP